MRGDRSAEGVNRMRIRQHLLPLGGLLLSIIREIGALVVREIQLVGHAPNHRQRAPSRVEVSLMLAHLLLPQPRQVIPPRPYNTRDDSLIDQVHDPPIRGIEVFGSDTGVILLPRKPGLYP